MKRDDEETARLDDKNHRKQLGWGRGQMFCCFSAEDRKLQEAQNIFKLQLFTSEIIRFHLTAQRLEETERKLRAGNTINTYTPPPPPPNSYSIKT